MSTSPVKGGGGGSRRRPTSSSSVASTALSGARTAAAADAASVASTSGKVKEKEREGGDVLGAGGAKGGLLKADGLSRHLITLHEQGAYLQQMMEQKVRLKPS